MKTRALLLIGGLALILLACQLPFLTTPPPIEGGPTSAPPPVGGSPTTEARSGEILLQDDFSNPRSGWEVGEYDAGKVGYGKGYYYVVSNGGGKTMWGVSNRSFTDVVIEVDATQVSGPANNNTDYGVICRTAGPDTGTGYYLLISGDGYYAIAKGTEEGFDWLVDFTESPAIKQGNATNHIRAVCQGSRLTLYVNGTFVGEASDPEFTSGDIALTATSYEDTPVEVRFEHLVVSRP